MSPSTLHTWISAFERVLLALWIGALWTVGFLVAPVLFAELERPVAGSIAGILFGYLNYFGLGAGTLLLARNRLQARPGLDMRALLLTLMLLFILVNEFALAPEIAALRRAGFAADSSEAVRFGQLHGAASVLYGLNALFGMLLLILGVRRTLD